MRAISHQSLLLCFALYTCSDVAGSWRSCFLSRLPAQRQAPPRVYYPLCSYSVVVFENEKTDSMMTDVSVGTRKRENVKKRLAFVPLGFDSLRFLPRLG